MKKKRLLGIVVAIILTFTMVAPNIKTTAFAVKADGAVAKVGNDEYATIDEALANWTNGSTLTLLSNVTLSDVITLKSTEHHILNLGTYTITSASGKNVIEITCNGLSKATYALTVNADSENPGGITATGKSCIYYKKSGTTKDRPIILINGGIFNGSYSLNFSSNGNTNCPQAWIKGGIFNGNVSLTKCMLKIDGGVFNGWINCTGDSSAYRLISGGKFKSWQFMTADAPNKFAVGSSVESRDTSGNVSKPAVYDKFIYVDNDGYLNVVDEQPTDIALEAKASYSLFSNYLEYSSAKDGLYYQSLELALSKAKSKTSTVVGYVELEQGDSQYELGNNMTFDLTIEGAVLPISKIKLTKTTSKLVVKYTTEDLGEDGKTIKGLQVSSGVEFYKVIASEPTQVLAEGDTAYQITYSLEYFNPNAQIADTQFETLSEAVNNANSDETVVLLNDVIEDGLVINKNLVIDLNGKTYTIEGTVGSTGTKTNGLQLLSGYNVTIKNGTIKSSSAKILIQNYANLTLENVILDGTELQGNMPYTLSNNCGSVTINNCTIKASKNGIAFDVCDYASYTAPIVTVINSTIEGNIEVTDTNGGEFSGKLVDFDNGKEYNELCKYVQFGKSILPISNYNLTINLSSANIHANDELIVEIVVDKDYYTLDYLFTYDATKFTCEQDVDNDGVIEVKCLTAGKQGVINTYKLKALNEIIKVTTADLSVNGNVVQYPEQALREVSNVVNGDVKQVKISLDYTAEIKVDYVTGYSLVVINGEDLGYAYNDEKTFYVDSYKAFAILIKGEVSIEDIDLALSKTTLCKTIYKSYNVNEDYVSDGVVDLKDATAIYACYNLDFAVSDYMELFLKADLNNDYKVDYVDVNEVNANYTK